MISCQLILRFLYSSCFEIKHWSVHEELTYNVLDNQPHPETEDQPYKSHHLEFKEHEEGRSLRSSKFVSFPCEYGRDISAFDNYLTCLSDDDQVKE